MNMGPELNPHSSTSLTVSELLLQLILITKSKYELASNSLPLHLNKQTWAYTQTWPWKYWTRILLKHIIGY